MNYIGEICMSTNYRLFLLVVVILLLSGCTSYGVINNPPISEISEDGYYWHEWAKTDHNSNLTLMLSFSGGGTRAAALAYGVLQGLRDSTILIDGQPERLLDQIDVISSVSGGSFTAAYYGLHGDGIFETFEEAFLYRNLERHMLLNLFNPIEWFRKGGRTQAAIRYYNDIIFHDATFNDINLKTGPMIFINASDLGRGVRFTFLQGYFNLICSDLSSVPVAKAVAASSAVPLVFLPVVFESYPGCEPNEPDWLSEAEAKARTEKDPLLMETVRGAEALMANDDRRYIHLVDGGITDNLGLHAIYDIVTLAGGMKQLLRDLNRKPASRFVVIVVNSSTESQPEMDFSNKEPSMFETIDAMSDVQLHRYNTTTLELMKNSLNKWTETSSTPEHQVKPYFIRLNLSSIRTPLERRLFNQIPDSFGLNKDTVSHLIETGRELLYNNAKYQKLISDLGGSMAAKK
jgi:NTE family protein